MQTTKALVGGGATRQSPSEAETLLGFGYLIEAGNLPAFNIWRHKKNHRYMQFV